MSDSKNIDFDGIDEFIKDPEEPAVAPISIEDLLGSCSSDKEVEVAVDHNKQDVLEQFIKDKEELPQQLINNDVAQEPKLDQGVESGKHDKQELLIQFNEVEEPGQDQNEDEGDDNLREPTSGIAQVCLICEKYYLY